MTTINDAYINALLADATYALNGLVVNGTTGGDLKPLLAVQMTDPIARYISDNFTVVTHIETDDVLGSGFDATVWRKSDGKLYVSMQGTTGAQDFLADVQLAFTGNAGAQVVDMINRWLKITTPVGQQARQITINSVAGIGSDGQPTVTYEPVVAASVAGAGLISAADIARGVEVDGHSLGGYLASAFTRLLGVQANVTHTSTFNSAGFASGSEFVFRQYEAVLGAGYGLGRFPNTSKQTNYFAENGINVTTNTFWFSQVGQRVSLFNEESTGASNHAMYKLTDSLALANAMATLDSTMTIDRANALFKSGSNQMAASLEGVLDGLRRAFLGFDVIPTFVDDADGNGLAREAYHAYIKELSESAAFTSLAGQLKFSAPSSILSTEAKTEFSALVALDSLSTVVLRGTNTANQDTLNATLGGVHADLYALWQADQSLSPADRAAGKANITDQWLADRTAMLNLLVQRNTVDTENISSTSSSGGVATTYRDVATSVQFTTGNGAGRQVVFGSNTNDSITGGAGADHLYGGSGSDNIWGGGGNDYIEGGDGVDQLDGEAGNDTLVGGAGMDTLTTGTGRDIHELAGFTGSYEDDEHNRYTAEDCWLWAVGRRYAKSASRSDWRMAA